MRARHRHRKNGHTVTYYFLETKENGKRKEIPLGSNYHEAIKQYIALINRPSENNTATFALVAAKYEQEVLSQKKTGTQGTYRQALKNLNEYFSDPSNPAPLEAITPKIIKDYQTYHKDTPTQANTDKAVFSNIWNYARENGYTALANPTIGIKPLKTPPRDVYIEDDLYNLVYQYADQQMKDLMDLAYITGQRPIDLVGIHANQIRNGILHIQQEKTQAKLRFEITGLLAEILERYRDQTEFLFKNTVGEKLSRRTLGDNFRTLRKKIIRRHPERAEELENFQFRDLRAKSGTDIYLKSDREEARKQLGHTSQNMTKRYIRKDKVLKPIK